MLEILRKVTLILLVLFVFILPGYLLRKTKLVSSESLLSFANVLLYVCQPLLSIKAFAVKPVAPSGRILLNFLYVFLFSLAAIFLTFLVSKLTFSFMKKKEERTKRDILVAISTFSNCSFVGLPFVDMFTGGDSEAMMYIVVFSVAFNFIVWTLGAYLITQDRKQISLKKAFLNPCTIGSVIGFLFFLFPQINFFNMGAFAELEQVLTLPSAMTAPLSMLIVGVRLAELDGRALFGDWKIYLAAALRLVVSFGLTYLLVLPFKLTGAFESAPYVLLAPVIAMSMPPASSVVVFAEKFKGERQFAAAAFSTGTLLSVITLPCILMLISL